MFVPVCALPIVLTFAPTIIVAVATIWVVCHGIVTLADTAGLVPWIGHHGLLIGGRLETRYRGVPIVLHRTFDWRLAAMSR